MCQITAFNTLEMALFLLLATISFRICHIAGKDAGNILGKVLFLLKCEKEAQCSNCHVIYIDIYCIPSQMPTLRGQSDPYLRSTWYKYQAFPFRTESNH